MSSRESDEEVGSNEAARWLDEHPNLIKLGRAGWAAKGFVYTLAGILAVFVAFQSSGGSGNGGDQEASQSGAIAAIAEQTAGDVLLVVIAAGLALYVLWRLVSILLPADNDAEVWVTRGAYLISAVAYAGLAWSAISFVRGSGSSSGQGSEDARVERFTRAVLEQTGGRIVVFAIGAALVGVGAYFLRKGVTAGFSEDLNGDDVGPVDHDVLVAMGRVGWAGRGLMMGLIGFFLAQAAIQFDPDDAQGLDGALRKVADSTLGTGLVLVVAVGLVTYGLFCILSAPQRRLTGAD